MEKKIITHVSNYDFAERLCQNLGIDLLIVKSLAIDVHGGNRLDPLVIKLEIMPGKEDVLRALDELFPDNEGVTR